MPRAVWEARAAALESVNVVALAVPPQAGASVQQIASVIAASAAVLRSVIGAASVAAPEDSAADLPARAVCAALPVLVEAGVPLVVVEEAARLVVEVVAVPVVAGGGKES